MTSGRLHPSHRRVEIIDPQGGQDGARPAASRVTPEGHPTLEELHPQATQVERDPILAGPIDRGIGIALVEDVSAERGLVEGAQRGDVVDVDHQLVEAHLATGYAGDRRPDLRCAGGTPFGAVRGTTLPRMPFLHPNAPRLVTVAVSVALVALGVVLAWPVQGLLDVLQPVTDLLAPYGLGLTRETGYLSLLVGTGLLTAGCLVPGL